MKARRLFLTLFALMIVTMSVHAREISIGTGTQDVCYLPIHMCFKSSLTETIYYASEINHAGQLTGITWYNSFLENIPTMATKIWVGETTQTDLVDGWIHTDELTQIFSGFVNYPAGDNAININFQTPYEYQGGNLVIMALRQLDNLLYSESSNNWYYSQGSQIRSRNYSNDLLEPDPATQTQSLWVTNIYPNIKLHFRDLVEVTGHVVPSYQPSVGLEGVAVSLSGPETYTALTNANGDFTLTGVVDDQTYNFTITADSYQTITGTIAVGITDVNMGTIMMAPTLNPVTNVHAIEDGNLVLLNWNPPFEANTTHYRVYRLHVGEENNQSIWTLLTPTPNVTPTFTDSNWNVLPSGDYRWAVIAVYGGGLTSSPAFSNHIPIVTGIEDQPILPIASKLNGNYPNPFNPNTIISYSVQQTTQVSISIYDLKGQKVKTIVDGVIDSGEHTVLWNGKDELDRAVTSGVYFYNMKAGTYSSTKKMILMK